MTIKENNTGWSANKLVCKENNLKVQFYSKHNIFENPIQSTDFGSTCTWQYMHWQNSSYSLKW